MLNLRPCKIPPNTPAERIAETKLIQVPGGPWPIMCAAAASLMAIATCCAAEPSTIITVTDRVLTPDIQRLGINLGADRWLNGVTLVNERISNGGFEGVMYRQCSYGPAGEANAIFDWWDAGAWKSVIEGSNYTILNGPRMGEQGVIQQVTVAAHAEYPERGPMARYVLSGAGEPIAAGTGYLLEKIEPDRGIINGGGTCRVSTQGPATVTIVHDDLPPQTQGRSAARLQCEPGGSVELTLPVGSSQWTMLDGAWRLRFWARGNGRFVVHLSEKPNHNGQVYQTRTVVLQPEWTRHEVFFQIGQLSSDQVWLSIQFWAGQVTLDDLSLSMQGQRNPTVFRDDLVVLLKALNPGTLRYLQVGGSSIDNHLAPASARLAFSCNRSDTPYDDNAQNGGLMTARANAYDFGLHDFLQLCEQIQADPWYCTPGGMHPQEMRNLIEYLAGSADSPYGKIRAAQGRSAPWTTAFRNIHIEIGNEAWNSRGPYRHGGFNGPGYWNNLFTTAKSSPCFDPKIQLHAGGQAWNTNENEKIVNGTPAADSLALAPYALRFLMQDDPQLADDEQLFSWVFGFPWYESRQGVMAENYRRFAVDKHMPLSIYEINYHLVGGDAPVEPRNRIVAGVGGAVAMADWMLQLMQNQKIRVQNVFTLGQLHYTARQVGNVRLWGTVVRNLPGKVRVRPLFLAMIMLNRVLDGDLVEVVQTGANPKWLCTARYAKDGNDPFEVPYIHAYATRRQNMRGLILINLHRTQSLPVEFQLPGAVVPGSIRRWILTGDHIDANNEPEHDAQVVMGASRLAPLAIGQPLMLKPYSMTVIQWEQP